MKPVSSHLTSCFLHFLQCIWIKLFFKLKIEVKLTSVYHCLHVDGSLVACFPLHPHARQSKSRMTQFLCRQKQCFQGILLQPWVFLFLHKSGTRPTRFFLFMLFDVTSWESANFASTSKLAVIPQQAQKYTKHLMLVRKSDCLEVKSAASHQKMWLDSSSVWG